MTVPGRQVNDASVTAVAAPYRLASWSLTIMGSA